MNLKKLFTLSLLSIALSAFAVEPNPIEPKTVPTVKIYGFVGNDFYYNSRQNVESCDGLIHLFPKVASLSNGIDANATSQAEMLSVNSRFGFDISGTPILGARSSAKIEADFAGTGGTFFLLRIRHAYAKLNWKKTELTVGQTWHPLFGSVAPTTLSANGGAPFQPFNRCPQIRVKYNINNTLSATAFAGYEMQYASQGPSGTSNSYMKNAATPDAFVGLENRNAHWISGFGFDIKTIKPTVSTSLTSIIGMAYAQYNQDLLTIKGKAIYGQNPSDQTMIGGYGISDTLKNSYTNFNTATGWLNATYGTKFQVGLLLGYSKNLGTEKNLQKKVSVANYTFYGYGTDCGAAQTTVDELIRVAPQISYNLPNIKFMLEYNLDQATYGKVQTNGTVKPFDPVINHRAVASVSYIF